MQTFGGNFLQRFPHHGNNLLLSSSIIIPKKTSKKFSMIRISSTKNSKNILEPSITTNSEDEDLSASSMEKLKRK